MKYPTVFHLISSISSDKGIIIVLIGGFAVNSYKVTRQTVDIDFLITKSDFEKIHGLLGEQGYREDYVNEVFVKFRTDSDYLMDLDFIFIDKKTLDKIIKEGKEISIAKQNFIVPSLDHLIALKLHSIKNNPNLRITKDLPDIIELIRANKINVENNGFKELCKKYGTQELYNEILKKV